MKTTQELLEEVESMDRLEINRLTKLNGDLLTDSKRHEARAAELQDALDAKYDGRQMSEIIMENVRLKKEVRQRDKFIGLMQSHLLTKRLGKLGLHNKNQLGFAEYKKLIDDLDSRRYLFPMHAGNYKNRIVKPKNIYCFEEYMKKNWRKYYSIKIDQYNSRTNRCRFVV